MEAVNPLSEDAIYRASTQYRLWSFTTDSLAEMRAKTNSQAIARVKDAFRRTSTGARAGEDPSDNVDCLTTDEEQKLLGFYGQQAIKLAELCELPTNIKATAVQYLKRFYLSNSPMDYHPKELTPCAIFFATKTDHHYMSLKSFSSKIPKATEESVIAPEYLLTQGLRFNFDVRHPHRGLEGGFMELQSMAAGKYQGPSSPLEKAKGVQSAFNAVEPAHQEKLFEKNFAGAQKRIQSAHQKASQLLKTAAIVGDAYLLYTPAQIWLGAFMAADEPLCTFYLETILASLPDAMDQVIETIHGCAALLTEKKSDKTPQEEVEELKRIDKKLYKCRNPEKTDITKLSQSEKRLSDQDGAADEKVVKKIKLEEKAKKQLDDPFGPSIGK